MKKTLLLLASCAFLSCTPQKLLEKEKFEKSYSRSLKKMQKEKKVGINQKILTQSLDALITEKSFQKNKLIDQDVLETLEPAIFINQDMQSLIQDAVRFTHKDYQVEINYLNEEENRLKIKCANLAFNQGLQKWEEAYSNGDKFLARSAYEDFQKAKEYDYEDEQTLDELLENSFEFAQIIYGLDPIDYDERFFKWSGSNDQFLMIFPTSEIFLDECDCIVEIIYGDPSICNDTKVSSDSYERKIQDGTETVKETKRVQNSEGEWEDVEVEKTVPKYITVSATVTVTEETRSCTSRSYMKVRRMSKNCRLEDRSWTSSTDDSIRDVDVSGDSRAITGCVPSDSGIMLECESSMKRTAFRSLKNMMFNYLTSY